MSRLRASWHNWVNMTDVPQTAVLLLTANDVPIWPNAANSKVCSNKGWPLFAPFICCPCITHFSNKWQLLYSTWNRLFVIWLLFPASAAPIIWLLGKKHHSIVHVSLCLISVRLPSSHLSLCPYWARFLSSFLATRLAGCQLLIYTSNISAMMMAYGTCQIEYNKQGIRFHTSWWGYVKRKGSNSNNDCIVAIKGCVVHIIKYIPF